MGTFGGHILPGSFFFFFGMWMAVKQAERFYLYLKYNRYYQRHEQLADQNLPPAKGGGNGKLLTFTSSLTSCYRVRPSINREGLALVVISTIGSLGELATGFDPDWSFNRSNLQHITMYTGFCFAGILLILRYARYPLPTDVEYLGIAVAFALEAILFYYHLHGRSPMDTQVHMMIVLLCCVCAVAVLVELRYRNHILPALTRSASVMLQGLWFCQVAFILYPPWGEKWDQNNHKQLMLVTLTFIWHVLATALLTGFICCLAYMRVRSMTLTEVKECLLNIESSLKDDPFDGFKTTESDGDKMTHMLIPDSDADDID